MKFILSVILTIILFSVCLPVSGQDKPFLLFNEDNGLANNDVRDIIKDNSGYLWIATCNGLSKYDGKTFTNFHVQQGLAGKWVWSVEKDDDNRIYAGCFSKGLTIIENDKVVKTLYLSESTKNSIRRLHYSSFHKLMFVGTDYGLYALKDSIFTLLSYPNKAPIKSSVLSITEYNGKIYFSVLSGTDNGGFYELEINTSDLSKSRAAKIISGGQGYGSTQLNGKIYAAVGYSIYSFEPEGRKINEVVKTELTYTAWTLERTGEHTIGLGGFGDQMFKSGFRNLDLTNQKYIHVTPELASLSVNHLFYDKELNFIWIGSCSQGLYCLLNTPFYVWDMNDPSEIRDITTVRDSIYAMTEQNIWKIDGDKVTLKTPKSELKQLVTAKANNYFKNKNLTPAKTAMYNLYQTLIHGRAVIPQYFIRDEGKNFLMTSFGTVSFPDFHSYLPIPDGHFFSDKYLGYILWIPNYDKIHYFKSIEKSLENPYFVPGNNVTIKNIIKILKSGKNIFMVSTFNGLFALNGDKAFNLNSKNSALDNSLSDIDLDNEGNLWCSSSEGKLYKIKFDGALSVEKFYDNKNSKITGDNYKWISFTKSHLLIGTNKGLNKIPLGQLKNDQIDTVFLYNKYNGYDFISALSPVKDSLGNVYVHTANQVIKISNDFKPTSNQRITFQEINVEGRKFTRDQFNGKELSGSTENIIIRFSIVKLPNSNNVDYRFMVNASKWETGNTINLQSLKPGKYTLVCEAKDKESSIRYQEYIHFQIKRPFWQSFWFVLLTLIGISICIYWVLHQHFKNQKRKYEERVRIAREISDLHIKSLQAQMNPHFIFNSLNSIQHYILSNDSLLAANYLSVMGRIIRMNLENISEEFIPLSTELDFLDKYVSIEKMRFDQNLNISIQTNLSDKDTIYLPPMLIQPLIENSIKHGIRHLDSPGSIEVNFDLHGELLIVSVKDNGIGRINSSEQKDHTHKSLGLDLITKRLSLLNQKNGVNSFQIFIFDLTDSGHPAGTEVKFHIPQRR